MRKLLPVLVLLSTIYFLLSTDTIAQSTYEQTLSDYQFTFSQYRNAHQEYSLARNRYLGSKTLTNKQSAFEATKDMLTLRNKTLDNYFILLQISFQSTNPPEQLRNTTVEEINSERAFISQNQAELDPKTTLEGVLEVSGKLEEHYEDASLQHTIYKVLSLTLAQKEKNTTAGIEEQLFKAEAIILRMEQEGEDVSLLRTWADQIKDEVKLAKDKQTEALASIDLFGKRRRPQSTYNKARQVLESSHQSNLNAISFLFELLREIKF